MLRNLICKPQFIHDGGQLLSSGVYEVNISNKVVRVRHGDFKLLQELPTDSVGVDLDEFVKTHGFQILLKDVSDYPNHFIEHNRNRIVKRDEKLYLKSYFGNFCRGPLWYVREENVLMLFSWEEIFNGRFRVSFEGAWGI